jgi:copper chaperone
MTQKNLSVPDISCEHCERTITGALARLDGMRTVRVDIPGHQVTVEFDDTRIDLERIVDVLREEEYPVASVS